MGLKKVVKEAESLTISDKKTGILRWFDGRERNIRYSVPTDNIKKFYKRLIEGKLLTTKFKKCGKIYFFLQRDFNKLRKETLETLTTLFIRVPSFEAHDPHTPSVSNLEDDSRILAWLRESLREIRVGQKARVEVSRREEDYEEKKIILCKLVVG